MPPVPTPSRLPERRRKLFHGLADPSRLELLYALTDGPRNVTELVERTGLGQSNASNHLACLLGCGLVARERRGRFSYYRLADDNVAALLAVADRLVAESATDILACPRRDATI
jgi:DNA-binding transcriptional ArsR family regulator